MKRYVDRETTHKILTIVFVKGHMVILTVLWTRKLLGLLGQLLHRAEAEIESRDKLALLWGEAQKKIAYSYLKVT